MKRNKALFVLTIFLFVLVGCEVGDGELKLDDDSVSPPLDNNTVPSTSKSTLPAELQWYHLNAVSGGDYTIELTGTGNIGAQNLSFPNANDVTIRLVGKEREQIVQLTDNGNLFRIGAGVTLVVGNNVTLRGHDRNNVRLISVDGRGTLVMESGAKIQKNNGGGIYVDLDGSFIMRGGEIFENRVSGYNSGGGGVYVATGGYFLMENGRISGNTSSSGGGGVYVANGIFIMKNGDIINNTSSSGGGVEVYNGTFTMDGGRISGNTASTTSSSYGGGGVYVGNAIFTMNGGEIFGNTARSGGGVFVAYNGTFTKTAGTIYGYVVGDNKRNTATTGITSNDKGHAVFVNSSPSKRRETTAGGAIPLNSEILGAAGGWE